MSNISKLLSKVARTGSYNDLSSKPSIPNVQIQSDWNQVTTSSLDFIKNKPTLATVAISGSYNDLSNKPTISTNVSSFTNDSNYQSLSALKSIFVGSVQYFPSDVDFGIWTLCNGRSLNRVTYSILFGMLSFTLSGNMSNASSTISNISSTSNLKIGMIIEGLGIPSNTTIVSIVSGTSIIISANATVTASTISLRFFRNGVGSGDGSVTFILPNTGNTVLQSVSVNTNVTQDFMMVGGNGSVSGSPISSFGNWFICTGV